MTKAENHSDQGSSQEVITEAQNLGISIISIRHGLEIQKSMQKRETTNQNFEVKPAIVRERGIKQRRYLLEFMSSGCAFNCIPQKDILKPESLVLAKVTLFGNGVLANVMKLR